MSEGEEPEIEICGWVQPWQQGYEACLRRLGKKDGWYGNQPYLAGMETRPTVIFFWVCRSRQREMSAGEEPEIEICG